MKKIATREFIAEMIRDERDLADYCHVEHTLSGNYMIVRDIDSTVLVTGKELKGYLGDIIYPQYDGWHYLTGDFRLTSDLHGLICKWKEVNPT